MGDIRIGNLMHLVKDRVPKLATLDRNERYRAREAASGPELGRILKQVEIPHRPVKPQGPFEGGQLIKERGQLSGLLQHTVNCREFGAERGWKSLYVQLRPELLCSVQVISRFLDRLLELMEHIKPGGRVRRWRRSNPGCLERGEHFSSDMDEHQATCSQLPAEIEEVTRSRVA